MSRKYISCFTLFVCLSLVSASAFSQGSSWKRVPGRIASPWADSVDPARPLPDYPRPQMKRNNWVNLNGLWDYSITPATSGDAGTSNGKILVPFAIESSMSGVGKTVGKDSLLWYNRKFRVPNRGRATRVLLHFGAVDWRAEVMVNGQRAGIHEGGFDPFYFDITPLLKGSAEQDLVIKVWDPTDQGPQPRGKQVVSPEGIWYTPVTGIWQTVWLEIVPETYIRSVKPTPDIDNGALHVNVDLENAKAGDRFVISLKEGNKEVSKVEGVPGKESTVRIPDVKLWSPAAPFLYKLDISIVRNGKAVDKIESYAAMRKSSVGVDSKGIRRMLLNNQFIFQYGPLDQGWWPDGLYTAPTDKALMFDVVKTKEMGFNMIRKHIKVEPARWYYFCDSIGLLVWQDMPSGDLGNRWNQRPGVIGVGEDKKRSPESEAYYKKEWNAIIDALYHFPSIVVWTPFNEAWGQFKTEEVAEWTMKKDSTRLINSASGGNFAYVDHILDIHNYPEPAMPEPRLFGKDLALVLGEFGGLGLPVKNHLWQDRDNWGYQTFKTADDLLERYRSYMDTLANFIGYGLSAAVYTQTTDVEGEINGLLTYDRKVMKNSSEILDALHRKLYEIKVEIASAALSRGK